MQRSMCLKFALLYSNDSVDSYNVSDAHFFFFMANLLCSKKSSHIPSNFCHLMVSRTSRTKMICLGPQKQLGAVGVTCQWQHCPALAAYKLIVIRLYPGNYTTKSLWGAMQLNGK